MFYAFAWLRRACSRGLSFISPHAYPPPFHICLHFFFSPLFSQSLSIGGRFEWSLSRLHFCGRFRLFTHTFPSHIHTLTHFAWARLQPAAAKETMPVIEARDIILWDLFKGPLHAKSRTADKIGHVHVDFAMVVPPARGDSSSHTNKFSLCPTASRVTAPLSTARSMQHWARH